MSKCKARESNAEASVIKLLCVFWGVKKKWSLFLGTFIKRKKGKTKHSNNSGAVFRALLETLQKYLIQWAVLSTSHSQLRVRISLSPHKVKISLNSHSPSTYKIWGWNPFVLALCCYQLNLISSCGLKKWIRMTLYWVSVWLGNPKSDSCSFKEKFNSSNKIKILFVICHWKHH